jgi:fructosamine-3-kinase
MDSLASGRQAGTGSALLSPAIVAVVERAASAHLGRDWRSASFTDRGDRAAHPAGLFGGEPFSVFAKLNLSAGQADAESGAQFRSELTGLHLITRRAQVRTPTPIGPGLVPVPAGWLLLFESIDERVGTARTHADFLGIGATLAKIHQARSDQFGLPSLDQEHVGPSFFGPLVLDNRPVSSNRWADFYAERRIEPMLALATDSGRLPPELGHAVGRLLPRLPALAGPEPLPSLLHGDAQQNNFLCAPDGTAVIDACPSFGHPEVDLALIDYFAPVPPAVFDGYRELAPIDAGFADRRELWRIFAYLAVIAVDGHNPFGRQFADRLAGAIRRYR